MNPQDQNPQDRHQASRRRFLTVLGATAAVGAAGVAGAGAAHAADATAPSRFPINLGRRVPVDQISIQLYSLRSIMGNNPEPVLAQLAEIGYRKVELAGTYGLSAAAMRAMLDRNGLRASSSHIDPYGDVEQKAADAATLGQSYANMAFANFRTERQWAELAEQINVAARAFRRAGVRYGYHNHDWEFRTLDDSRRSGWDVLSRECDRLLVHFELDVYWADVAGEDPVDVLRRQPRRFPQLHMKDRDANGWADLGTGTIDFRRILAANLISGAREFVVEHDNPPDPLNTARVGFEYLRNVRY